MTPATLHVLLVEDNDDDYIIVRDLLADISTTHYVLEWVDNYAAARDKLSRQRYDICLLDYSLGETTDMEIVREFGAQETPFVLLTGSENYEVDVAAAKAGAADYLLKSHINAPLLERSLRYAIERKRTTEALRRSEERYRAFVGNSTEAIWCCELKQPVSIDVPEDEQIDWFYEYGYISECNEAMALLYGFSHPQEMVGARLGDLLVRSNPDNIEYLRALIRSNYRLADAESCEVDSYGQTKYFLNNLVGATVNGFIHRIWGTQRDITERREDERTRAQLAAIVESSEDAIISKNLDGVITTWNAGAQNLYGYSAAEAIGQPLAFLMPAAQAGEVLRLLEKTRRGESVEQYETVRVCKNGSVRDISLSIAPLKDSSGNIIGDSSIERDITERDITERKLAEAQLLASEANLATAQQMAHLGSWEWELTPHEDWRENRVHWSDEVFRIFGYAPGEVEASYDLFKRTLHPDDIERIETITTQSLRDKNCYSLEHRILLPDGTERIVHEQADLTFDASGQPERIVGTVQDITERKQSEEELRMSEEKFQSIVANVPGMVYQFELHPNGVISWPFISKGCREMFEVEPDEIKGNPGLTIEMIYPDDKSDFERSLQASSNMLLPWNWEGRLQMRSGKIKWVQGASSSQALPGGGVLCTGLLMDITARKEAESALRQMRDELEVRVQERTAELAQSNAALQTQIKDREKAEAETRTRARQQEAVAELGRQALKDIDMETLLNGASALVVATLDVEMSVILELLPSGDVFRICAGTGCKANVIGQQIPATIKSQAGYALLSKAPVIVADWRTETRFEISQLLLEQGMLSGITMIVGGYDYPFGTLGAHTSRQRQFTKDDLHFLESISNILAAAIERHRIETEMRQLNAQLSETNEQLRIENIERIMTLKALQGGAVVLEQAREQAEQARENAEIANRAKSEFLSRMSHELRTPLNAILGFGQILEMRCNNTDLRQQESIQQILKAGRHLLALINEVLDIARIEAGHMSLSPEPIAVVTLVREALDLVRPLAASQNIELINEIDVKYANCQVLADQQRFKQVLLNLLSNAVKYNRENGNVAVACEIREGQSVPYEAVRCAGWLRILVRDTGLGLSAEEISRLFISFERLGAARTQIEGTGIGLSICKRLVEAMHGQVGVESEVGRGSTFWLELPLVQSPPMEGRMVSPSMEQIDSLVESVSAPSTPAHEDARTVLYIEDNISNINLIEHVLSGLSGQIRLLPVMLGSLGFALAAQHNPDLILLDVNLPDTTGDEVLQRLKNNPATQSIPVVVLSADVTPRQIERMMSGGAIHYLTKPLDIEEFFGVLQKVFKTSDGAITQDQLTNC